MSRYSPEVAASILAGGGRLTPEQAVGRALAMTFPGNRGKIIEDSMKLSLYGTTKKTITDIVRIRQPEIFDKKSARNWRNAPPTVQTIEGRIERVYATTLLRVREIALRVGGDYSLQTDVRVVCRLRLTVNARTRTWYGERYSHNGRDSKTDACHAVFLSLAAVAGLHRVLAAGTEVARHCIGIEASIMYFLVRGKGNTIRLETKKPCPEMEIRND